MSAVYLIHMTGFSFGPMPCLRQNSAPGQGAFKETQSYQIYLMNKVLLKVDGVGEKGHIAGGWHLFLKHNYV